MGAQTSNFLPQAHEQFVWVQRPVPCTEAGVDFNPSEPMLPHISALISHGEWTSLLNNIKPHIDSFQKILWVHKLTGAVCFPLFILGMILPRINESLPSVGGFLMIPAIFFSLWKQSQILQANEAVDRQIEQVVQSVSTSWASRGVSILYQTMHTGLCLRKGTQRTRLLRVTANQPNLGLGAPATAGGGGVMQVTIPQGYGEGQTMQVQTPIGTVIQVTVPPGSPPGTSITVSYPAPISAGTVVGNAVAPPLAVAQPAIELQPLNQPAPAPVVVSGTIVSGGAGPISS